MPDSSKSPTPTDSHRHVASELRRWRHLFSSPDYIYGDEAGSVARRAVRYHRPYARAGATALDAGCGEGQDLAYLAEEGYRVTGVEFTPEGAAKTQRLLESRALMGEVVQQDLREYLDQCSTQFDLILAVNSLQFLGTAARPCLEALRDRVAPGGVIGLSLFGREPDRAETEGTLWFVTLPELLQIFEGWQPMEATNLWQWNLTTNEPQPFVTLVARKAPPATAGGIQID